MRVSPGNWILLVVAAMALRVACRRTRCGEAGRGSSCLDEQRPLFIQRAETATSAGPSA